MSKRSKACAIPKAVKRKVYERDNHRCVACGRWVEERFACAHYIARAHGGLGVEENILTLCEDCHWAFDHEAGDKSKEVAEAAYAHLCALYGKEKITRDALTYNKWKELEKWN